MTPADQDSWGPPPIENQDSPRADIWGVRLAEDTEDPTRARRLTDTLAAAFGYLGRKLAGWFSGSASTTTTAEVGGTIGDAGGLAVSALAGRLEGASLEGDLKRAEIQRLFAEGRKLNAEAAKIESDMAWSRLEAALALANTLGVPLGIVRLADGTPCVTIGDRLGNELPVIHLPPPLNSSEAK